MLEQWDNELEVGTGYRLLWSIPRATLGREAEP
jgi:hypothetical protein